MSTSATKDCRAALAHAKGLLIADIEALFAQLDEHVGRNDPRLTYAAMESRHEPIQACAKAVAKHTADVFHALAELGTDVMDDFRGLHANRVLSGWSYYYDSIFEEVAASAEAERQERAA